MHKMLKTLSPGTVLAGAMMLSALPLIAIELFPMLKVVFVPASYLLFHNIAEVFSILVSLAMFSIGWYTYDQSKELTDVARLEGKQFQLERAPLALAASLAAILAQSSVALDIDRVRLDIPDDLPPVLADNDRLQRIVTNLLSNALKYSAPATPVQVRARLREQEVMVSIADQGQGIHPDDISRLFSRFYRAKSTRRAEGIGLGLYITRLLVEAHGLPAEAGTAKVGGRIWVESEVGKGSTFYFTLPIVNG